MIDDIAIGNRMIDASDNQQNTMHCMHVRSTLQLAIQNVRMSAQIVATTQQVSGISSTRKAYSRLTR